MNSSWVCGGKGPICEVLLVAINYSIIIDAKEEFGKIIYIISKKNFFRDA
jgi:hypothetical protein